MCPARVLGCATKEKTWAQFNALSAQVIEKSSTPWGSDQFSKFNDKLQLDKRYKDVILALVKNHESSEVKDGIEGKGNNLITLLHGELGVFQSYKQN
jgi:hypothetical protein